MSGFKMISFLAKSCGGQIVQNDLVSSLGTYLFFTKLTFRYQEKHAQRPKLPGDVASHAPFSKDAMVCGSCSVSGGKVDKEARCDLGVFLIKFNVRTSWRPKCYILPATSCCFWYRRAWGVYGKNDVKESDADCERAMYRLLPVAINSVCYA